MNKTELENAIKNGESVWCLYIAHKEIEELYLSKNNKYKFEDENYLDGGKEVSLVINYDWYYPLKYLFKTKAEAEHYLHHANIVRTEELPFLTWEEFVKNKKFYFYDASFVLSKLSINDEKIVLSQAPDSGEWDILKPIKEWDLTEANFYKAYDECVRLFRGEE